MPLPTPQVTGSDILSYHGDPGLAAGAGTGLMPITVNPLAGVDSTLDKIQDQNHKEALMDYQQKIQQQEDLRKMLSQTGGSIFNMADPATGKNMSLSLLPQDQEVADAQKQDIHKLVVAHPSNFMFRPEWDQLNDKYNETVNEAQRRSFAYGQYNQQMAQETDPEEQANIKNWRDQHLNVPLGSGVIPEPYLMKSPINPNDWVDPAILKDKKNFDTEVSNHLDDKGNLVEVTKSSLNPAYTDFRASLIPGSKGYQGAVRLGGKYINLIQNNPAALEQQNAKIDEVNKAWGYAPGSPHYVPHIGDFKTDPSGKQSINLNTTDPATIAYVHMMEKLPLPEVTSIIKKNAQDITKEDLQNQQTQVNTAHTQKIIDQMDARLAIDKQKADEGKDKMSKEDYAEKLANIDAQTKTQTVMRNFQQFHNDANFKTVAPVNEANPTEYKDIKELGGFDAKGFQAIKIPFTQDLKAMGGEPNTSTTPSGEKNIAGSQNPVGQIYLKSPTGNMADDRIAYKYQEGKGEHITYRYKIVDAPQAISGLISDSENYKGDKTTQQSVARKFYEDHFGSNPQPAEATQPAPAAPGNVAPKERPANVPAAAVRKSSSTGTIWVDKANKKFYDENGAEVKIK